jgi:uncharacterized protein (TIGR03086 family)
MDVAELHRRAVLGFGARVHAIGADQWRLPTPCPDWDVHSIVNHLVGENRWTAPLMSGMTVGAVGDRFDGDLLGDDPKRAWEEASAEAVRAVRAPGALDRIVHLSFGDVPGSEYAWQLFADHLVHTWDLARAIGADDRLDEDLVAACAQWFSAREEQYRAGGVIGDRVSAAEDADEQTRLLAAFGRDPQRA